MKRRYIIHTAALFVLMFAPGMGMAQKKAKKKLVPSMEHRLNEEMIAKTAKVMFIDSMVADKSEAWWKHIPLDVQIGSIEVGNNTWMFQTGMGNKRIIAPTDSLSKGIAMQGRIGNDWEMPQMHRELNVDLEHPSYPFMMADGKTLFFSAESKNGAGGRDVYVSTFDADEQKFLQPENYGLPFNSTANDYLLVIDDVNRLGWLVSDRHQPEGKLCIYCFEPSTLRVNLIDAGFSLNEVRTLAPLPSIKATWAFGDREAALARLQNLKQQRQRSSETGSVPFVINDNTIYRQEEDFRSAAARDKYRLLLRTREKTKSLETTLELLYRRPNRNNTDILKQEKELMRCYEDIEHLEKEIRNEENQKLR